MALTKIDRLDRIEIALGEAGMRGVFAKRIEGVQEDGLWIGTPRSYDAPLEPAELKDVLGEAFTTLAVEVERLTAELTAAEFRIVELEGEIARLTKAAEGADKAVINEPESA